MSRTKIRAYLYVGVTSAFFALLVNINFLSYTIWGQIEYLNKAVFDLSSTGLLTHLTRYIVVWPAYYLADIFSSELDFVYSNYVLALTGITSVVWCKIREVVLDASLQAFPVQSLVPFGLLFAVNGRFMFALFGLSLILYSIVRAQAIKFDFTCVIAILVGLFYASVSSGTFMVGLLYLLWSLKDMHKRGAVKIGVATGSTVFLALVPALLLGWLFIDKNVSYFAEETGSAFRIISHGIGLLLDPFLVAEECASSESGGLICQGASLAIYLGPVISGVLLFLLLTFIAVFFLHLSLPLLALRGVFLSVLMGIFGITTLFSMIFVIPILIRRGKCRECFRK